VVNKAAVMHVLRLMVVALLLLLPQTGARAENAGPPAAQTAAAIAQLLQAPDRMALPVERIRQALKAHYVNNRGPIYWVGTGRMNLFIQRLQNATYDGLNPADYPISSLIEVRDSVNPGDALGAARAELYYDAFLVAYAADLRIGRIAPQKVDPALFRNPKTIDVLRLLTELQKQGDPAKFLTGYEPRNPHYQALKKMMRLYTAAAGENNWPVIAQGPMVKPGMSDPRIPKVRALLAYIGDFEWDVTASPVYDQQLAIALTRFQKRHGLEAKGLLGKQTILALNVTPAERAQQIMLNMERWRWMPDNLGDEYFMINIAGFELQHVQSSVIVDRMNVVAGAVATQTPEFSDEMEYVELNPYWTVPYNIATKEMLPKLQANPMAYADDFDVFVNGRQAAWEGIDWYGVGAGNFPFTFRQRPGPKNALGKVKFMFPNKQNIYLHDTPAKDKFASTSRAFSHGCIRLSRPIDLAHVLIDNIPGWSPEALDAALASGENQKVVLPRKIPVHLIYATAFKGENGIEFRADIYGRDRKLEAALAGKPAT
jgi:murein L,D-transpeptidase YcbB/YkuD